MCLGNTGPELDKLALAPIGHVNIYACFVPVGASPYRPAPIFRAAGKLLVRMPKTAMAQRFAERTAWLTSR